MIERVTSMSVRDYESFRRDDERFRRSLDAQDATRRRVQDEMAVRAIDRAAREQRAARQATLWTLRLDLMELARVAGVPDAFTWVNARVALAENIVHVGTAMVRWNPP